MSLLELSTVDLLEITEAEVQVIEIGTQGPAGPQGLPGTATDNTVIAATAISGHIAVVLDASGEAIPADPTNPAHSAAVIGITRNAAAAGGVVTISSLGSIEHLGWVFSAGHPVYLGLSGALTPSPPVSAVFTKVLGVAQSATRITVSLQPAIFVN